MVHMSTTKQYLSNNTKLRELVDKLVDATGLKQAEVLDLLNEGQARPVPLSTFKAWIAKPTSMRIRLVPNRWMEHASAVLNQAITERNGT